MPTITPDLADLFEEAYEQAGLEMKSGYDLATVRRSLNLLLLEWQNRGLNLFMIEPGTVTLVAGTANYTMPTDTIDLIEHQIRSGTGTDQLDTHVERISVSTYARLSNKNSQGRPSQIHILRRPSEVVAYLWPTPDQAYTLAYYRLAGVDGLASGVGTTPDIPPRFVPALVAGLAFHLAKKKPGAESRVPILKQEYEMQFELASREDRERASLFLLPGRGR